MSRPMPKLQAQNIKISYQFTHLAGYIHVLLKQINGIHGYPVSPKLKHKSKFIAFLLTQPVYKEERAMVDTLKFVFLLGTIIFTRKDLLLCSSRT